MPQLIFDIETIGEDFDALDETSQHMLTRWIEKTSNSDEEYKAALADLKNELGFSPLTGQIVAIGVLDAEKDKGCVYFQAPGENIEEFEEKDIKYKQTTEKEMLEKFWELAKRYTEFVSFNGRCFDAPFLIVRSAINKIKPSKDLLSNRYLKSQAFGCSHIDLFDQLSFYGAFRPRGSNLHMWTRAFGIESPKDSGVNGDDVAGLFKEKRYLDIAKYNALDIRATKKLYDAWNTYVRI